MSHKLPDGTFVIAAEKERECQTCGKEEECRPYGKNGAQICHSCMMATPETRAAAKAAFQKRIG